MSFLTIGVSGMQVNQQELNITGQNLTNASNPAKSAKHDDCHRWLMMNGVVISISESFPPSVAGQLPRRPSPAREYRQA